MAGDAAGGGIGQIALEQGDVTRSTVVENDEQP